MKPLYEVRIPLRFADQDVNAHINNVAFFRFFEEARVQILSQRGLAVDGEYQGPVVAETQCRFIKALHYPGTVIVRAYVDQVGNRSYRLRQELVREEAPAEVVAESSVSMVWIDHRSGRACPLPDNLRAFLQPR